MPTAAKLVGGIVFFLVGFLAAEQAKLTMPEGTPATYFSWVIAVIGFVNGWMVMGTRAHDGAGAAMSNGVRTSVQIAIFGLIFFALRTMFLRAMDLRYDSIGDSTAAAMDLLLEYGLQSATIGVWSVLLLGGVAGGFVVHVAAQRWD